MSENKQEGLSYWLERYRSKSDLEIAYITEHSDEYQREAVAAAQQLVAERGITPERLSLRAEAALDEPATSGPQVHARYIERLGSTLRTVLRRLLDFKNWKGEEYAWLVALCFVYSAFQVGYIYKGVSVQIFRGDAEINFIETYISLYLVLKVLPSVSFIFAIFLVRRNFWGWFGLIILGILSLLISLISPFMYAQYLYSINTGKTSERKFDTNSIFEEFHKEQWLLEHQRLEQHYLEQLQVSAIGFIVSLIMIRILLREDVREYAGVRSPLVRTVSAALDRVWNISVLLTIGAVAALVWLIYVLLIV